MAKIMRNGEAQTTALTKLSIVFRLAKSYKMDRRNGYRSQELLLRNGTAQGARRDYISERNGKWAEPHPSISLLFAPLFA